MDWASAFEAPITSGTFTVAAELLDEDALLDDAELDDAELEEALEDAKLDEADLDVLDAEELDAEALDDAELDEFAEHEHPASAAMQTTSARTAAKANTFFMVRPFPEASEQSECPKQAPAIKAVDNRLPHYLPQGRSQLNYERFARRYHAVLT